MPPYRRRSPGVANRVEQRRLAVVDVPMTSRRAGVDERVVGVLVDRLGVDVVG
jgi:hypothetical protein